MKKIQILIYLVVINFNISAQSVGIARAHLMQAHYWK